MDIDDVTKVLNQKSGFLGLSNYVTLEILLKR